MIDWYKVAGAIFHCVLVAASHPGSVITVARDSDTGELLGFGVAVPR